MASDSDPATATAEDLAPHLDLFDAAVVENGACSRIKETVERRYTKPA